MDEYMRLRLFDETPEGCFWDYDNNGVKLAQLRFYPEEQTDVPAPVAPEPPPG
ncbi:MAG TPA: hypothetical protein VMX13_17925 [Sedimentisphaerales bacterium]|nr:hypothetical protein [Sedimentisphaerales bacterium]